METEKLIPIIISVASLLVCFGGLLFTAFSFRRTAFKDSGETVMQRATMTADIKYIRAGVEEIKVDNKVIQKDVGELKTKVAQIDEAVTSAHRRIDDIRKELSNE